MKHETCTRCANEFSMDENDLSFYEKMKVPSPTTCPDCRFKMRALFRNEMTLYSGRKCELCQKNIVTMYNPKSPYKVYCHGCFYSEKWDPKSYAVDYDMSRSFMDQMGEFLRRVPKVATYLTKGDGENVNSEYVNMASGCKNAYLVFNTSMAEDSMYCRGLRGIKDSADLYFATSSERCYESINVQESTGITYSQNVVGCVDSHFILNGSGLMNCFGCVNLRNKSYHWFNEQLTREDYTARLAEVMGSSEKLAQAKKEFEAFSLQFPRRENNNIKTVGSTGDYLFECKNMLDSFESTKSEDCRYVFASKEIRDSLGTTGYGAKSEQLLECIATGHCSNVIGTYGAETCQNIMYSFYITNCHDCIGCDALRNGQYSIFNKEYSKEEYETLKAHIVSELSAQGLHGLIFPPEIAPFAYNETVAQDNFPLTKEQAAALGFRWEEDIQITKGKETISSESIPDNIKDVTDSIMSEILKCSDCERNYKITAQEFQLYQKMNLPIPRKCFYCRHQARVIARGPYKFWDRNCAHCSKAIVTNYAPERPEIVYCESCYQQEVI